MNDSLFTITSDDLSRLNAEEAVAFLSELFWSDATRLGIPTSKIHISADVNTPDGGVDATVTGDAFRGDLIRPGHTAYQVKSGAGFHPERKTVIQNELFGEQTDPSKDNLKRRIRECLDRDGTYVLVATAIDSVDRSVIEGHLRTFFIACGYTNPKVEVWVQNQLCSFVRRYPSLALRLNGHEPGTLRSHASWSGDTEMENPFQSGGRQSEFIADLRSVLQSSGDAIHVHARGEAGIGKTRLVLEATRAEDLKPLVLYTNSPAALLASEFMSTATREDNHFAFILVVDECDAAHRTQIWNRLKARGQRIKLVTIYNEWEESSGVSFLDVPPLEQVDIVHIIEGYSVPEDQAERFAGYCSGSPRVAHVLGLNLQQNPEDLLKPIDTVDVWNRYVVGSDPPSSAVVADRLVVLRYVALFKRFGYGSPVLQESRAISAIIEAGYPHITWPKFQEVVTTLRKRKILQGEATLYITPKLLHIWLWAEWWSHHGIGFDLDQFAKGLKGQLLPWFQDMFRYAEQSQVAQTVVGKLLGPSGPFSDAAFSNTRLGGDFFLALTEVDPQKALACLQRTIGTWSREELLKFRHGRRGVIWGLERIAVWQDLFHGAAKVLLQLAEAENETWSNNATGVFAELFSLGQGDLAPTEASPSQRLSILAEALTSNSQLNREVALKACDVALKVDHFVRMVGAESQGFKPKAKLWTPKTYGEIWEGYRQVWNLLLDKLSILETNHRAQAIKILFHHGGAIASVTNLGPLVLETWKDMLARGWVSRVEILEHLIDLLRYRREELRPEVLKSAEAMRDELVGTGFPSNLKRYVGMNLSEDESDNESQRGDSHEKQIRTLVEECLEQPDLLRPELSWLVTDEAKNGYRFGYELARRDTTTRFLHDILEAQRKPRPNTASFFLSGYLRSLFETGTGGWELLLDELAMDERLRIFVPELTWRSGMTDRAALRVLRLARSGEMEISRFGMFCLGSVIKDLSEDVFRQWSQFLVGQPAVTAVKILLNLIHCYYLYRGSARELPADIAFRALTHPALFQKYGQFHTMDRHHWAVIGVTFVSNQSRHALELARTIIDHFGVEGSIIGKFTSETHKVLMEITRLNPREVWELVSARLGPPIDTRAFHLKAWLRGDRYSPGGEAGVLPLIPFEYISHWVDASRETRSRYLASFVPKQLFRSKEQICLAREVLIRYGADSKVRFGLICNFSTEGWSGSASGHYLDKQKRLLEFKTQETEANVKLWIDEFVEELRRQIDDARVSEEREDS